MKTVVCLERVARPVTRRGVTVVRVAACHRERSTASANRRCGHHVSSESCCAVWCSPTRGSLSRFKCHSDARSTFSCSIWTLVAACDAVQFGAQVVAFFGDSGRTSFMLQGAFRSRRWQVRQTLGFSISDGRTCVALQWCVSFDGGTCSLLHKHHSVGFWWTASATWMIAMSLPSK